MRTFRMSDHLGPTLGEMPDEMTHIIYPVDAHQVFRRQLQLLTPEEPIQPMQAGENASRRMEPDITENPTGTETDILDAIFIGHPEEGRKKR